MLSQPLAANKEILGYTLKERIGSGGFGEVWSAVAPGGLLKAVKIVYGFHDEKRAQTEMKALDRAKELRHPFLLSLERIEIFENQLVVVTELADNSLADVFNQFAAKGEPGIPREDLIKYIRCAGDALDYLSNEHNLQHLDIKPENLLMVSGHVKVADFGLIKDLQNASQSLMSGMTPAYAAPELFDGRPGKKSDQYSLAIVYQEMLTGARPFPGATPAQLAAQHMHGKPNLRLLPKTDQPVIAKALSKDPAVRFRSCVEMAEELSNKKRSVKKAIRRTATPRFDADTESQCVNLDSSLPDVTAIISNNALPFQAAELEALDPPECSGNDAKIRPTLIIGVGATANRVVQKIKGQLIGRHGSLANVPATKLLCIDTDRQDLTELQMRRGNSGLVADDVVEIPIRKAADYRSRSNNHLTWLSRRWIYNIPRSQQTEGLRPLGRLAFADHFEGICDRILSAIKQIATPEAIARSADTLEMDPGELAPRVYIVTSISGGIGSGLALDLAYTVKLLMQESGLNSDSVSGILLHSSYQRNRDPGLAAANSIAFLTEMRHFVEHGYPGDETLGLPEFEDEKPFDFTYFNSLGNDLPLSEFDEKLNRIAEYIYLASNSPCAEFFDKCHELESEIDHFALRTFGISVSGPGSVTSTSNVATQVSRGLARRWLNGCGNESFDANTESESILEALRLNQDAVIEKIGSVSNQCLDGTFDAIVKGARDIASTSSPDRFQNLVAYLDGVFGCPTSSRDASHVDPELCNEMEEVVGTLAHEVGDQLSTRIFAMLDDSTMKFHETVELIDACSTRLEALRKQLDRANEQCENSILQQLQMLHSKTTKGAAPAPFERVFKNYCELRRQEFVMRYAKVYYRGISQNLDSSKTITKRFKTQIEGLEQRFSAQENIEPNGAFEGSSVDSLLNDSIIDELNEHITRTERQVFELLIKECGGYLSVLNESAIWQNQLPTRIRSSAQQVLADAYKKISLDKIIANHNISPEQLVKWLTMKMREAQPQINQCGGASRLMVGLPALSLENTLPELLEKSFSVKGSTVRGTQGSFVVCFEGENVPLANVAYRLLESRPDAIELVKRIQTRADVEWSTLDDLL